MDGSQWLARSGWLAVAGYRATTTKKSFGTERLAEQYLAGITCRYSANCNTSLFISEKKCFHVGEEWVRENMGRLPSRREC